MKKPILILTLFVVCIFQSWAQVCTDTVEVFYCENLLPYKHTRPGGMTINYQPGVHCEYFDFGQAYLQVIAVQNSYAEEFVTLCQNKAIMFHDKHIVKGSDYSLGIHTIPNLPVPGAEEDDCDIIITLHLNVVPAYNDTIKDKVCTGVPYLNNKYKFWLDPYEEAGIHYITKLPQSSQHGCDSIITLQLTVNPRKEVIIHDYICEGDTFNKNGFNESTSGIYTNIDTTVCGCDSITTLFLTVYNFIDTLKITACENDLPYYYFRPSDNWKFKFYETGIYPVDTIKGGVCDSIIYIDFEVIEHLPKHEWKWLCQNETFYFQGEFINGANYSVGWHNLHFYVPPANDSDCDDYLTLHFKILPAYNDTINDEICEGALYYSSNGFTLGPDKLNTAGTFYFTDTLPTHYPDLCDSIVTLKLTVHPRKEITIRAQICDGAYSENDFNESVSGTYTNYGQTTEGCDSITTLILTVYNFKDTLQRTVCDNELPFIYTKKSNNERIECVEGLQIVDTIHTGGLCDSIIYLNLEIKYNLEWYQYETICQNEMLNFYGNIINEEKYYPLGKDTLYYYVSSFNPNSCDTLMKLVLTVLPTYNDTIEARICAGEDYLLNGFWLFEQTTSETYTINPGTHQGCDSIITLKLTVNQHKERIIYDEICEGETYLEYGFNENAPSGTHTFTNIDTTIWGCDSITTLILTVHNNIDTLEINVCRNELPYIYTKGSNGERIPCEDILQIVDTIPGALCDSVIYLKLNIEENKLWYKYETLCQNEILYFYGNIIYGADHPVGNDTLYYMVPFADVCDTLMKLILTIVPATNDTIVDKICLGEDYNLHGFGLPEQNTAGTFYFTHDPPLLNHYSCDSITTLILTVNPHKETTIYAEICENETYSEYGFNESAPTGTHTFTNIDTTTWGCDSITTLYLTVYNASDTLEISVCNNKRPYYYEKHNGLRIPCEYGLQIVDTLITSTLCDVVIYVNLDTIPNPERYKYETLCQNATLNFHNNIINGADYPLGLNTLHYTVPSANDCDTLLVLFLTVHPAYNDTIIDKICLGEPYYLHGFGLGVQDVAGTFYHYRNHPTYYDCDSIITLILTVNPQKEVTIYAGICEGETYTKNGFNESTQGTYTHYGTSVDGCDSTTILILSVFPIGENLTIDAEICEGNVYQANGFNVSKTGTYIEERVTDDGCPYTITLNLTVLLDLKMDTLPIVDDICGNYADFPINYNVLAGKIDSIFVSFNEKADSAGFLDFVEHKPSIDHIKIPLPLNIQPDNYSVTLYFDGRCSDTTFTVNFTVLYPSSIMEQRWNDVIILKNAAYNGGYDFSYIEWLVNGRHVIPQFNKGTYIYTENSTLQFGAEYRVLLTRIGDPQQFCSCPLKPIQHSPVSQFPHLVSGKGSIQVYSDEPIVELSLINMLGQIVKNGRYANTEITINADAGFYIIRLITDKGQIFTQKIIVQQ